MKNILHKKNWNTETVQVHVETPLITLIKSKNDDKLGKYCFKIKQCKFLMSQKLKLYGLKMALFANGKSEEFLLFIRNFSMTR